MKNSDCTKCGMCCTTIRLHLNKKEVNDIAKKHKKRLVINHDAVFIAKNWKRISKERVKELNSWLYNKHKNETFIEDGYFYECKMYDKETNLCTIHDNKPSVCRDYPLYPSNTYHKIINGGIKLHPHFTIYSKYCCFNKILATEKEWNIHLETNLK